MHAAQVIMESVPLCFIPPKQKLFASWRADYLSNNHHTNLSTPWISITPPEDSTPLLFIQGALSHKNQHIFSVAIQISTGHGFNARYSHCFWPSAGDNVICHCSGPLQPIQHTIKHVLLSCPLHQQHHRNIFGPSTTMQYILSTYHGG